MLLLLLLFPVQRTGAAGQKSAKSCSFCQWQLWDGKALLCPQGCRAVCKELHKGKLASIQQCAQVVSSAKLLLLPSVCTKTAVCHESSRMNQITENLLWSSVKNIWQWVGLALNSDAWIRILFCRRQYKTKTISVSHQAKNFLSQTETWSHKEHREARMKIIVKEAAEVPPFPEEYTRRKGCPTPLFPHTLCSFGVVGWCHQGALMAHAEAGSGGRVLEEL